MSSAFTRLFIWTLIAASGPSALSQDVHSSADHDARLSPYLEIQVPPGPGPFPAMIMVTGCSGFHNERFSRSYDRDGNRFVELGYAVARADFVRAHGLLNSCSGDQNRTGEIVPNDEIAKYIFATVDHMVVRNDIDADRVYLIGWSLGGTGIIAAMTNRELLSGRTITAVLNYFPGCDDVTPWTAEVPMLLMLAELDNINLPQYCRDLVQNSPMKDMIKVVEYPGAHHCFTFEDTAVVTGPQSEPTCAYGPEAHRASWLDVLEFLDTH